MAQCSAAARGASPKLLDLGVGRIADMDEAAIDLQASRSPRWGSMGLIAAPRLQWPATSCELAGAVRGRPNRLAGFATLPSRIPAQQPSNLIAASPASVFVVRF